MTDTCRMVAALKEGKKNCEGLFKEDSEGCMFFKAHTAASQSATPPPDQGFKLGPNGKPRFTFPDKPGPGEETGEDPVGDFLSLYFTAMGEMDQDNPTKWGQGSWDDTPCRKLLWTQSVLPASAGRTELRLDMVNPIDSPATCKLKMVAKGKTSSSTQTAELNFEASEGKSTSYFFLVEPESTFAVSADCNWGQRVDRDQPEPAKKTGKEGSKEKTGKKEATK